MERTSWRASSLVWLCTTVTFWTSGYRKRRTRNSRARGSGSPTCATSRRGTATPRCASFGAENEDECASFGFSFSARRRRRRSDGCVDLLPPCGEETRVTMANRTEYVHRYAEWYLVDSVAAQFDAFRGGLALSDSAGSCRSRCFGLTSWSRSSSAPEFGLPRAAGELLVRGRPVGRRRAVAVVLGRCAPRFDERISEGGCCLSPPAATGLRWAG